MDEATYLGSHMAWSLVVEDDYSTWSHIKELAYLDVRKRSCLPGAMDEAAYLAPRMKQLTWRHG